MSDMNKRIAILSGGHGGARIARELLRQSPCSITLIINAFDDGKSTGALRAFIPGMLGPSDIRKNLSQLVAVVSPERFYLSDLLEYRLDGASEEWGSVLRSFAQHDSISSAPAPFADLVDELQSSTRSWVRETVSRFLEYETSHDADYEWVGTAFGNILFAGVYIKMGHDFNNACASFAKAVLPELRVVNATASGAYFLRGITVEGTALLSEADVINPPRGETIEEIFIHGSGITGDQAAGVVAMSQPEKRNWMAENAIVPPVSREASEALSNMDALIVAPGTPHSSLFPTLIVLAESLKRCAVPERLLIGNLDRDDDVLGFDHYEIVKHALRYGDDRENQTPLITDLLIDPSSALNSDRNSMIEQDFGVRLTSQPVRSLLRADTHSAAATATAARNLIRRALSPLGRTLYIVVDPSVDPLLLRPLIDDFCDIRWDTHFHSAKLLFKRDRSAQPSAEIELTGSGFSASVLAADNPLATAREMISAEGEGSDCYLLRLAGDGYYSLSDAFGAVELMEMNGFGAVVGSRVQDRRQLSSSLRTIYGERALQRRMAEAGAGLISAAVRVREGFWLSDPLSGFLVLRVGSLPTWDEGADIPTMRSLTSSGTQIGEMPVRYFTLAGFTTPSARIKRGLRVLRRAVAGDF